MHVDVFFLEMQLSDVHFWSLGLVCDIILYFSQCDLCSCEYPCQCMCDFLRPVFMEGGVFKYSLVVVSSNILCFLYAHSL